MTTRENAIGEGVIEVGHSDQSLLIDYVAHLELDYEMPPIGKGEKLTDEQIASPCPDRSRFAQAHR